MGVLGAEIIKKRIKGIFEEGTYDENNISFASYDLRVDDEEIIIDGNYYHRENKYPYDKTNGVIILPGRRISVISTMEKLKLPDDLCIRIGITFSLVRRGLIPLFGPQIDPGYRGKFYAVIYNTSPDKIELRKGDRFLKMEVHSIDGKTVGADGLALGEPPFFEKMPEDLLKEADFTKEDFAGEILGKVDNLEKKHNELNEAVRKSSTEVGEVSRGYRSVTYFGVFLVAASIFGVILAILLSAASSINFASFTGERWPMALFVSIITIFLVSWILTVIMVIKGMFKERR
ncbi:MAG: hypothetical protein KAT65_09185 [Methanophagales archaeon]|jgi:dCTP deaminase|nr:hypothetical protein [Methanophagales archaeon]